MFLSLLMAYAILSLARFHPALGFWYGSVRLALFFLAGTVFYQWRGVIPRSPWFAVGALALLAASTRVPGGLAVALPIALTYLLFHFAFGSYGLAHWGKRGDFSYGTYLYAFPIQQLLVLRLGPGSPLANAALALPLSVLAGVISWHAVEKHFLKRGRSAAGPPNAS
jgi:peptidoglycan/LPS O-acetylase OafA/YrhL